MTTYLNPLKLHRLALALLLCTSATAASAATFSIVLIQVRLSEQAVERVQSSITDPIADIVKKLAKVKGTNSTSTHGSSTTEIEFEEDSAEPELALVREKIQAISFDKELGVQSMSFALAKKCAIK